MRTMRLMAGDGQSGGVLAVLLALCLFFQAFTAPIAAAGSDDQSLLVLCDPAHSADPDDGHGGAPAEHDCCPGICQTGGYCAPPASQPDLGAAWPERSHPTPAQPHHAPAVAYHAPGPIQPRAPPDSP
ncbi:MAG: hypothetical protein KIS68_00940 [Bauldia sp.]|nr:hypothetical protein [Bauldia sp.]